MSRLCKIERDVHKAVDPIDANSLDKLADIVTEISVDWLPQLCARKCDDIEFFHWVNSSENLKLYAECRPSVAKLRALLEKTGLSLSKTCDMYSRMARILGQTCIEASQLRSRDSGVSVGSIEQPEGGEGGRDQALHQLMDYDYEVTVDPRQLTGTSGGRHIGRGIDGTQSSRRS
jgi:hypothetical protein